MLESLSGSIGGLAPGARLMSNRKGTKVARNIEKYDIQAMGSTLEARWTGATGERTSLRNLAHIFNRALVDAALREGDVHSYFADVDAIYDALQNGSNAERLRAERRLTREGIDVDALTADFVTHQAVHTYLRQERDVSLTVADTNPVEKRIKTIEKLEGRGAAVAQAAVSRLPAADDAADPAYEVLVEFKAVCTAWGDTYAVRDLLRRDGCGCRSDIH